MPDLMLEVVSGSSAKKLYKIRPDLFYPNCDIQEHNSRPCLLRKPAAGEDLYVKEQDIAAYFEAAISLWQEFSIQIEEHSQKRDRKIGRASCRERVSSPV